jgi:hypothetical protein
MRSHTSGVVGRSFSGCASSIRRSSTGSYLELAGWHVFAIVQHRGRRSGQVYTTPVVTVPIVDGFIILLTFGADTDWCRNVLAAGQCTLQSHGLPIA